jgi:hypothetical protein
MIVEPTTGEEWVRRVNKDRALEARKAPMIDTSPVRTILSGVTEVIFDDLVGADEYHFMFDVRGDAASSTQIFVRPRLDGVNEAALVHDYGGGYGTAGVPGANDGYDVVEIPLLPGARLDANIELGVFRLNEEVRTMVKGRFFEVNAGTQAVSGSADGRFTPATAYNGLYFRFTNAASGICTLQKIRYA